MDRSGEKTSWQLVLEAQGDDTSRVREAMSEFARRYWPPVYAHIRRKSNDPERALDLTQEFFAAWIEKGWMQQADPSRGRFRTFLYVVLDRFLAGAWDHERAAKRGGDRLHLAIDADTAERLSASGPASTDPARRFTQEWALTVIRGCLDELRVGLEKEDRRLQFDLFVRYYGLAPTAAPSTQPELAREFDLSDPEVNNHIQRARALFRRTMEARVRESVENPEDSRAEISDLFRSLSS